MEEIVQALVASLTPQYVSEAANKLEQLSTLPSYCSCLVETIGAMDFSSRFGNLLTENISEEAVKIAAAIALKNFVRKWNRIRFTKNSENLPVEIVRNIDGGIEFLKENLVKMVISMDMKVRNQFGPIINLLAREEFLNSRFPSLIPSIVALLQVSDAHSIHAGCFILKNTCIAFRYLNSDIGKSGVNYIVNETFPHLIRIFNTFSPQTFVSETSSQSTDIIWDISKIFFYSSWINIPDYLRNEENFDSWMKAYFNYLGTPLQPMDNNMDKKGSWKPYRPRKWMIRTMERFFNRYGDPKVHRENQSDVAFSTMFRDKYAGSFLSITFGILQNRLKYPDYIVQMCLSYIDLSVHTSAIWKQLQPHIGGFITDVIFPILQFNSEDLELYLSDPTEYVLKNTDLYEQMISARSSARTCLADLVNLRTKATLKPLMEYIYNHLNNYNSAAPNERDLSIKFAVLDILNTISHKLLSKKPYSGQCEQLLAQHVFPELMNPEGAIRDKACEVMGSYSQIEFSSQEHLNTILNALISLSKDPDLPVRVSALCALPDYFEKNPTTIDPILLPVLPSVLESYFSSIKQVASDTLINSLTKLIMVCDDKVAPFAAQVIDTLCNAFIGYASEESDDQDETGQMGLAALETMTAILAVLNSIVEVQGVFQTLVQGLVGFLHTVISPKFINYMDEIMEIFEFVTFFSELDNRVWSLWEIIFSTVTTWGAEFIPLFFTCIDNFISRSTELFLQNPENLKRVIQLCDIIISPEYTSDFEMIVEEHARIAPKIYEVLLLNCKGRIDGVFEHLMKQSMSRLDTARTSAMKVLLLDVLISGIYYNPELSLKWHTNNRTLSPLLQKWIELAPKLNRFHDKSLTIITFCQIYTIPFDLIPPILSEKFNDIFTMVVNVGFELVKQLKDLKEEASDEEFELPDELDDDQDAFGEEDIIKLQALGEKVFYSETQGFDDDEEEIYDNPREVSTSPLDEIEPFGMLKNVLSFMNAESRFASLLSTLPSDTKSNVDNLLMEAQKLLASQE